MRYSPGMPDFDITSPQNERIKRLRGLRDRRHRDEEGVFVVEGARLLSRAVEAGHQPLEVYTDGTVENPTEVEALLVEPSILDLASYRKTSQGVIAIFPQWSYPIDQLQLSDPALLVAAESLEKPGNLGALMRTAAAIGADGLVTIGGTCDPFNPNAIRSSTGALFALPVVQSSAGAFSTWLEERAVTLVALTPDARNTIWEADLTDSCALMIGAEDIGLSQEARQIADETVAVPMHRETVDSLNTSVALAVAGYEAFRQRELEAIGNDL